MTDEVFAHRVSLVIRWALAGLFAYLAYQYKEARLLYILSVAFFITGLFKPKRCTDTHCTPAEGASENELPTGSSTQVLHFEILK
jgi:hypothetical protein